MYLSMILDYSISHSINIYIDHSRYVQTISDQLSKHTKPARGKQELLLCALALALTSMGVLKHKIQWHKQQVALASLGARLNCKQLKYGDLRNVLQGASYIDSLNRKNYLYMIVIRPISDEHEGSTLLSLNIKYKYSKIGSIHKL